MINNVGVKSTHCTPNMADNLPTGELVVRLPRPNMLEHMFR